MKGDNGREAETRIPQTRPRPTAQGDKGETREDKDSDPARGHPHEGRFPQTAETTPMKGDKGETSRDKDSTYPAKAAHIKGDKGETSGDKDSRTRPRHPARSEFLERIEYLYSKVFGGKTRIGDFPGSLVPYSSIRLQGGKKGDRRRS